MNLPCETISPAACQRHHISVPSADFDTDLYQALQLTGLLHGQYKLAPVAQLRHEFESLFHQFFDTTRSWLFWIHRLAQNRWQPDIRTIFNWIILRMRPMGSKPIVHMKL
jgi:hypothetical protein